MASFHSAISPPPCMILRVFARIVPYLEQMLCQFLRTCKIVCAYVGMRWQAVFIFRLVEPAEDNWHSAFSERSINFLCDISLASTVFKCQVEHTVSNHSGSLQLFGSLNIIGTGVTRPLNQGTTSISGRCGMRITRAGLIPMVAGK